MSPRPVASRSGKTLASEFAILKCIVILRRILPKTIHISDDTPTELRIIAKSNVDTNSMKTNCLFPVDVWVVSCTKCHCS